MRFYESNRRGRFDWHDSFIDDVKPEDTGLYVAVVGRTDNWAPQAGTVIEAFTGNILRQVGLDDAPDTPILTSVKLVIDDMNFPPTGEDIARYDSFVTTLAQTAVALHTTVTS